ncbi:MAG: PIN domain nuclease [Bacteroidia bacterium]|nr:PIN domain nuclease [Bacteroidia bacterium]
MKKILVDTSVWIDAFNGKNTHQVKLLEKFIEKDQMVVLCPVIIQEILQGIKEDNQFGEIKDTLTGFEVLSIDAIQSAYGAAALYRAIRKKGVTIRKSNDCLIAFFAIYHEVELLHNDIDFDRIARHSSLKVLKK